MKKKILIAGFFVAIMMLVPITTAARTTGTNLLEASKTDDSIAPLPDGDPDGPTEGGLDDPTDWWYAGLVVVISGAEIASIVVMWEDYKAGEATLWELITVFVDMSFGSTIFSYIFILEAFDVEDLDRDGC